jgi:hypothetical protein
VAALAPPAPLFVDPVPAAPPGPPEPKEIVVDGAVAVELPPLNIP